MSNSAPELSAAQKRVYDLALLGYSQKVIAHKLCLSYFTVKFHLSEIYKAIGVRTTTEMVAVHHMGKEAFLKAREAA